MDHLLFTYQRRISISKTFCKYKNILNTSGGEWNSVWTIKNQTIEGEVQINCHYFENYNEDSNI